MIIIPQVLKNINIYQRKHKKNCPSLLKKKYEYHKIYFKIQNNRTQIVFGTVCYKPKMFMHVMHGSFDSVVSLNNKIIPLSK
jgi:hypothetical protein